MNDDMFELLDVGSEPGADEGFRNAVLAEGRRRLVRRQRTLRASLAAAAVVAVLGAVAAVGASGQRPERVQTGPVSSPETSTTVEDPTPSTIEGPSPTSSTTAAALPGPATTTTGRRPTTTTTTRPATTTTTAPRHVEPRALGPYPSVPPRKGVTVSLRLDSTSFKPGETIRGVFRIANQSLEDVRYGPDSCSAYHVGLYQDGTWVGGEDNGGACPAVYEPIVVRPGQTVEQDVAFDAFGPRPSSGERQPLPPGIYQAAVAILVETNGGYDREAWFTPSINVEVRSR